MAFSDHTFQHFQESTKLESAVSYGQAKVAAKIRVTRLLFEHGKAKTGLRKSKKRQCHCRGKKEAFTFTYIHLRIHILTKEY